MFWGLRKPGARRTEHDRLLMRALIRYEAGLCSCGVHRLDAMADEHNPLNPEHEARYMAGAPFRCHVCTELGRAQRSHEKALGDANAHEMHGLYWSAELVPRGMRRAD